MTEVANLRITLIDSSEEYRTTLQDLIVAKGYHCDALPSLQVGPRTWHDPCEPLPDVIILTVPLVPMPAWKLISDIFLYHPEANIIALSFSQDPAVARTTVSMGVKIFLTKYIDFKSLIFQVEQLSITNIRSMELSKAIAGSYHLTY